MRTPGRCLRHRLTLRRPNSRSGNGIRGRGLASQKSAPVFLCERLAANRSYFVSTNIAVKSQRELQLVDFPCRLSCCLLSFLDSALIFRFGSDFISTLRSFFLCRVSTCLSIYLRAPAQILHALSTKASLRTKSSAGRTFPRDSACWEISGPAADRPAN